MPVKAYKKKQVRKECVFFRNPHFTDSREPRETNYNGPPLTLAQTKMSFRGLVSGNNKYVHPV